MKNLSDLRGGFSGTMWCGPALIARALDLPYKEGEIAYKVHNPKKYARYMPKFATMWSDTTAILENAEVIDKTDNLKEQLNSIFNMETLKFPTLRQWIQEIAIPGTYAVRTSGHVQIIRILSNGTAIIHDNQRDQVWYPGMKKYSKIRCRNVRRINKQI